MRKKSLFIATFILIIDQVIKILIDNFWLYNEIKTIIPSFFYVTKVYNTGAAWSIFDNAIYLLIIASFLALGFLWYYEKQFIYKFRNILAFGLIYGGLLGNLVDRIIHGYVIDYLKLVFGNYNFPVFNIADIAIVIGFVLIFLAIIKGEDKNEVSSKRKSK